MSQKIMYNRTKERHVDKIVFDAKTQSWKNLRKFKTFGYDEILRVWNVISKREELMPLESYPTEPSYQKNLFVLIKRTALDPNSLKQLTRYFKQKLIVKSTDKSVLLTTFEGKLYQTNFSQFGAPSQPLSLNALLGRYKSLFSYLEVTVEEAVAISNVELAELLKQGYPLTEEAFNFDGSVSEFRAMI